MSESDDATPRASSRWEQRLVYVPLAAALAAALIVSLVMVVVALQPAQPAPVARPVASASPTPTPTPSPTGPCADQATEPFTPTRFTIPGVVRNASMLALPRDADNVPGVPPVSGPGKQQIGWDRPPGIKPGSPQGNVLVNAHTWPDGSALGNKFLAEVDEGDMIIVRGKSAELCYQVKERIEVLASDGYPPYYDREGPPQIALLVCSGKRLGPGNWTHRTIWFASPVEG